MKISNIKIGNRFRKNIGNLESLKNSIKELGLLQPIVVDEKNNLIAGYRRLLAFKELGKDDILVNVVNIKNSLRGEYDENTVRKDFAPSEAVAIWGAMESYELSGKKLPMSESDRGVRRQRASKLLKRSTDTLSKAKQVVDFGDKTLIDKMDKTGNVNRIYKQIKSERRKREVIKQAKKYKENDDIQIINNDFRNVEIADNSIDLILTDPPYPEEYLNLWQDLFLMAEKVLKPSGFLVTYSGQIHLDKIFKMKNNLIYYWTSGILFNKHIPFIAGRNVNNYWKPILVFQKAPFKKSQRAIIDLIKFDYTEERELHDKNWGQTIKPFEILLEQFSNVGDKVLDPFAGTGTTLLACKNKKRKCIGIEIEKEYVNLIKGRLYE